MGHGGLRDVLTRETPALFRADLRADWDLYAVPAVVGALVVGVSSTWNADDLVLGAGVAAAISVVRVLALQVPAWVLDGARPPDAAGRAGAATRG
ncbi:hypothetical protein [Kineococcus vitellinus]|uniref:hypothetical protein n=1 Tax=Kineococcus vitellinus TaxID=2696565 RepID=UPI0030B868CF